MKPKIAFIYSSFLASAICLFALAQPDQSKTPARKQWPKPDQPDPEHTAAVHDAVDAFTAALSRSRYDRVYRKRLTDSCSSAKQAVLEQGKIDIPEDVIIMFYEPGTYGDHFGFFLPPFDPEAHKPYKYTDDEYFECCFPALSSEAMVREKALLRTRNPGLAEALDAALTRAGYDSDFRRSLTVSCDSAREAVSREGHIQVRKETQMIFHDKKGDERYHILELPPFDGRHDPYEYGDGFRGLYPRWLGPTPAPIK